MKSSWDNGNVLHHDKNLGCLNSLNNTPRCTNFIAYNFILYVFYVKTIKNFELYLKRFIVTDVSNLY